jgi:hypothetical protein
MNDLIQLANLIDTRNQTEREITALIGRPAAIGHIGEYIASRIFNIVLEESASHNSSDGYFGNEPLKGHTVNIKWYAFQEGMLDITPDSFPDYYLVLTGLKSRMMTSRGHVRPWTIEKVFLFNAAALIDELKIPGVKIGIATSLRQHLWEKAEIYPAHSNNFIPLSQSQRDVLTLFRSEKGG